MTEKTKARVDIQEHGMDRDGTKTFSDRRLFMQLQVFGGCTNRNAVVEELERRSVEGVVYQDVNDPRGVGILTMDEGPQVLRDDRGRAIQFTAFRSTPHEERVHDVRALLLVGLRAQPGELARL